MSNNTIKQESRAESFKNEATRQRWDLFHRAIQSAKATNVSELENSTATVDAKRRPLPPQSANS